VWSSPVGADDDVALEGGVRQICRARRVSADSALVWLYILQPDRKLLVSAARELPLVLRILNEVLGRKEATSGAA
jgi:hypothetical protein